jgi:xylono-1,5-lactonase
MVSGGMMTELRNLYAASNQLGESAIWHEASQQVLWLDLFGATLFLHEPKSATTKKLPINIKGKLGAIVATTNPDVVILSHTKGLSKLNIKTGELATFTNPEQGRDAVMFNDCKVDRFGRLWAGTSHIHEQEARGALWCVLPNGEAYLGDVGFVVSNGPAFSLDGSTMYFNDSVGRKTFAYDISKSEPYPRNRREFISYTEEEGSPDGLTVDAEGCLWVAHWGGARVTRFSGEGKRLNTISIPAPHVTTVGFGGQDLTTLYITSARQGLSPEALKTWPQSGDFFTCEPGVKGLAEPLFEIS